MVIRGHVALVAVVVAVILFISLEEGTCMESTRRAVVNYGAILPDTDLIPQGTGEAWICCLDSI